MNVIQLVFSLIIVLSLTILLHYPHFNIKSIVKIDNVIFTEHDILSTIRSFNSNKAQPWDNSFHSYGKSV